VTVVFELRGDQFVWKESRTQADDRVENRERVFEFDGVERSAEKKGPGLTYFSKRLDDRTVVDTFKREGVVIGSTTRTISADGKTHTVATKMESGNKRLEYKEIFKRIDTHQ
jgi:hypothetical protein